MERYLDFFCHHLQGRAVELQHFLVVSKSDLPCGGPSPQRNPAGLGGAGAVQGDRQLAGNGARLEVQRDLGVGSCDQPHDGEVLPAHRSGEGNGSESEIPGHLEPAVLAGQPELDGKALIARERPVADREFQRDLELPLLEEDAELRVLDVERREAEVRSGCVGCLCLSRRGASGLSLSGAGAPVIRRSRRTRRRGRRRPTGPTESCPPTRTRSPAVSSARESSMGGRVESAASIRRKV